MHRLLIFSCKYLRWMKSSGAKLIWVCNSVCEVVWGQCLVEKIGCCRGVNRCCSVVGDRWSDGRSDGCHFLIIVGSGVRRMDVVVFCQEVSIESDEAWGIIIDVVW